MKLCLQRIERNFAPVGNAATCAANSTDATIPTSNLAVVEDIVASVPTPVAAIVRGAIKDLDICGKVRKHANMYQLVDYNPSKTTPVSNSARLKAQKR